MPAARATKAEMSRAIDVFEAHGFVVGGMEITPDGTIRIIRALDTKGEPEQRREAPEPWD